MASDTVSLNPHVRFRAVGDEGVALNVEHDQVLVVNGLGQRTLELIRATGSREAIIAALTAEYDAPPEQIAADLEIYLDELHAHHVLAEEAAV
jgi:hypothetical protein